MKLKFNKKDYIDIYTNNKSIIVEYGKVLHNSYGERYDVEGKLQTEKLESVLSLVGVKLTKFSDEIVEYLKNKQQIIRIKHNNEDVQTYSYVSRYTDETIFSSTNFNDLTAFALNEYYKTETLSV